MDFTKNMENIIVDLLGSLSVVRDLSEMNFRVNNEETLLKNALFSLIQNQDMERCSFFLLNDDNMLVNVTGLSYFETMEDWQEQTQPLQFKLGEGIIGLAAQKRSLQHCHNCHEDERFFNVDIEEKGRMPGSLISVPVFAANVELIGVLNISHPQPYYFNDWHIRLLEIYKNLLGQMITNFRLFHEMEQQIASRTAKLTEAYEDIKRLKEHYENMSLQDQLTGLYNRRYFYNQIEFSMALFDRYGQSMCLLILDIDHFKRINDTFGHSFGDQVLVDVATSLKQQVRHADVLVRFGGEEFIIIFSNTGCTNGLMFAERIREEVNELSWQNNQHEVKVTISIGIYCHDEEALTAKMSNNQNNIDQLVHYADLALYEAKKRGRNQVVRFTEKMLKS